MRVDDLGIQPNGAGFEPGGELAIGFDVPIPIWPEPHDHAVHHHGSVLVAGQRVAASAYPERFHTAHEDSVQQSDCVGPSDFQRHLRHVVQQYAIAQLPVVRNRILVCGRLERIQPVAVNPEDGFIGGIPMGKRRLPNPIRSEPPRVKRLDVVVPLPRHQGPQFTTTTIGRVNAHSYLGHSA